MDSGKCLKSSFSIFFQINRQDPYELCGLDRPTYLRLKSDDNAAYLQVKELLATRRMLNTDDEIDTIFRSIDDVEYMAIEFSPESLPIIPTALTASVNSPTTSIALFPSVESPSAPVINNAKDRFHLEEAGTSSGLQTSSQEKTSANSNFAALTLSSGRTNKSSKQPSIAWSHFTKIDTSSARCNICDNVFKHGGNTTNLIQHLKIKHPTFFSTVPKKSPAVDKGRPKSQSCDNSEDVDDPSCLSENTPPNQNIRKRQRRESQEKSQSVRIDDAFKKTSSFADGGSSSDRITNSILYMIATDKVPLSTVEAEGFTAVMKTSVPLYRVPSRKTITRLIHLKYDVLKDTFKAKLQTVTSYTLTCDNWTDVSNQSYLGVTIHWLSPDYKLKSGCLGVIPLHESHSALYLAETLLTVLQDFDLNSDNVMAVVSDRAANIKKAVTDTFGASKQLACFAHIISSIVPTVIASMPDVASLIAKVKNIVTLTKRSVVASDELKRLQIRDGKTEVLKFIQDVPTRWNSTFYMLERFLILEEYAYPITLKCNRAPEMLSRDEILMLHDFVSLLQPIENVIAQISGSLYPTCSIILPIVHCMRVAIQNWNPERSSGERIATKIGTEFKKKIVNTITIAFKDVETHQMLAMSTILDPRFKKLHFESALAAATAINKINSLIKSMTTSEKPVASCATAKPKANTRERNVWCIHDDLVTSSITSSTGQNEGLCLELRQYLSQPVIARTEDPFKHWQTLKLAYPSLHKIAIKYLSVVGTSVPSERLFSEAGAIKVNNRSRLSGDLLNKLLFLGSLSQEEWGIV